MHSKMKTGDNAVVLLNILFEMTSRVNMTFIKSAELI